jgi:hypothetical protein
MASEIFSCPECKAVLRYSPNLQPGAEVQCPKCKAQFPVPDPEKSQPRPRPRPTEDVTDSPKLRRPRFSEADDEGISSSRRPPRYDQGADDYEDEDDVDRPPPGEYSIDINRWFSVAGNHYSAYFGPAIGFIVVAYLITLIPSLINGVGGQLAAAQMAPNDPIQRLIITQVFTQVPSLALSAVLYLPLFSGLTAVSLLQLKGRRWTFGDFFSGFRHWGAFVGIGFVSQIITLLVYLPGIVIFIIAVQNRAVPLFFVVGGAAFFVGGIVLLFIQIRLLIFAPSLIFDRNLGAMEAMKANWQLTRGHFWGLFGVGVLLILILIGGALACGIGELFALPYVMLIGNAGYLLIAGRREPLDMPYISND